jgi:hypothetical protein
MRLRVTPLPASSRSAWVAFLGCPVLRSLFAEPASESSGCPLVSALRLCRRWTFELPRTSHAFGVAGFSKVPGFPGGSCHPCSARDVGLGFPLVPHLRLYRRWIVESPRFSHLSAVPTVKAPGCPVPLRVRYRRRPVSRLPQILHPPAPIDGYPSYLGSLTIRFALVEPPSRPGTSTLAYVDRPISRLP